MNDRLFALRLFARVARRGNFSAAAREFGLSQPSASRIVAALEREVGARLLTRTTRAVTLTEAGGEYLARVEAILLALEEADHAVRGAQELRGVVRVAASSSFSVREVIPRLPAFMARHPALGVELLTSDRRQDLVSESVDVAFRFGALADSSATARLLGASPRLLAAAPAYLARVRAPEIPADLADHALIVGPAGRGSEGWSFVKDGRTASVRIDGRLAISANEGAVAAAVAGLGIVSTSLWGCRAELASGALVRLLEGWRTEPVEVHAVFPDGRAAKPSARALVDYFAEALRA